MRDACHTLVTRCPFAPPQQQSLAALYLYQTGEPELARQVASRAAVLAVQWRLAREDQGEAFVLLAHITAGAFAQQAEAGTADSRHKVGVG